MGLRSRLKSAVRGPASQRVGNEAEPRTARGCFSKHLRPEAVDRRAAEMERSGKGATVEGGDQEQGGRQMEGGGGTEEGHTWAGGEQDAGEGPEA